jgi:N utilization substance protein B
VAELPPETLLAKVRSALRSESFPERRLGRALAFQALYETDLAHHALEQVMDRLLQATWQEATELDYEQPLVDGALRYARELLEGVRDQRATIDGVIQRRATAYPMAQMSAVDRNVLRIGLYESLFGNAKVPLKAAINEAVELAKLFGSETSAKFVNGVLGRAVEASATRADETAGPANQMPAPVAADVPTGGDEQSQGIRLSARDEGDARQSPTSETEGV